MNKSKEELILEYGYRKSLEYVRQLIEATVRLNKTNSQKFIDFLDALNEESVRF